MPNVVLDFCLALSHIRIYLLYDLFVFVFHATTWNKKKRTNLELSPSLIYKFKLIASQHYLVMRVVHYHNHS